VKSCSKEQTNLRRLAGSLLSSASLRHRNALRLLRLYSEVIPSNFLSKTQLLTTLFLSFFLASRLTRRWLSLAQYPRLSLG
jgi:hypothetical protein